jgi:hypothetical protein
VIEVRVFFGEASVESPEEDRDINPGKGTSTSTIPSLGRTESFTGELGTWFSVARLGSDEITPSDMPGWGREEGGTGKSPLDPGSFGVVSITSETMLGSFPWDCSTVSG